MGRMEQCLMAVGRFLEGVNNSFPRVLERASKLQFLNGVRCSAFCVLTFLEPLVRRC